MGTYSDLSKLNAQTLKSTKSEASIPPQDARNRPRGTSMPTQGKKTLKAPVTKVKQSPTPQPIKRKVDRIENKNGGTQRSIGVRTVVRNIITRKREKVRYPFDFYADQISRIKLMRREALINDGDFSMSKFIRKAVDEALAKLDKEAVR